MRLVCWAAHVPVRRFTGCEFVRAALPLAAPTPARARRLSLAAHARTALAVCTCTRAFANAWRLQRPYCTVSRNNC